VRFRECGDVEVVVERSFSCKMLSFIIWQNNFFEVDLRLGRSR
jgi:hypothetical protein